MRFCRRCLLPESYPVLHINSEGYCNVCLAYDHRFKKLPTYDKEGRLENIFEEERRKNRKIVVTCSGGIDSSYVLYLCKTRYKLDIIGAHFDHGFQSSTAKENLYNLGKRLNISIITISPDPQVMHRLYHNFLLKTGDFCTPCCQGCCRSGFIVADTIPTETIIHGGVSGSPFEFNVLGMLKHNYERFMGIVGSDYTNEELEEIVTPTKEIERFRLIALPQYTSWNERDIFHLLSEKTDWKPFPDGRIRHVDCIVADVADYLLQRKFGFSRQWMIVSAGLRAGVVDHQEGLMLIRSQEKEISQEPRDALGIFLETIGLTKDQVYGLSFYNQEPVVKYLD